MAGADPHRLGARAAKLALFISAVLASGFFADLAAAQVETPIDVLAVRVREQGYPCDKPVRAERDTTASRPNLTVWRLECTNASYRMVLHPDMAAEIEKLD